MAACARLRLLSPRPPSAGRACVRSGRVRVGPALLELEDNPTVRTQTGHCAGDHTPITGQGKWVASDHLVKERCRRASDKATGQPDAGRRSPSSPHPDPLPGRGCERVRAPGVYSNSRMIWPTLSVSPALACSLVTLPARAARRMFSIFIACTTASSSPESTLSPASTASDCSRPGIGESRYLDMSGGLRSGIILASSATILV